MTVNVTTLLVLTTLFISISDALPRTAYVKTIDLWLIINLLIPFVEIILISFSNMFYKENENIDAVGHPMSAGCTNSHLSSALFRVSPTNPKRNGSDRNVIPRQATMKKRGAGNAYKVLQLVAKVGLPAFYVLFCIIFFFYGMLNTGW